MALASAQSWDENASSMHSALSTACNVLYRLCAHCEAVHAALGRRRKRARSATQPTLLGLRRTRAASARRCWRAGGTSLGGAWARAGRACRRRWRCGRLDGTARAFSFPPLPLHNFLTLLQMRAVNALLSKIAHQRSAQMQCSVALRLQAQSSPSAFCSPCGRLAMQTLLQVVNYACRWAGCIAAPGWAWGSPAARWSARSGNDAAERGAASGAHDATACFAKRRLVKPPHTEEMRLERMLSRPWMFT